MNGFPRCIRHGALLALVLISCQPAAEQGSVQAAVEHHSRDVEVEGRGTVVAILPDDNEGSRHQRFLLRLDSGSTVLIVHNLDIAPRVASLHRGDDVSFKGEYIWNAKGGLVHWTHHDPSRHHEPGWVKHNGDTFQ